MCSRKLSFEWSPNSSGVGRNHIGYFRMGGFTPGLVLKQRQQASRKWPLDAKGRLPKWMEINRELNTSNCPRSFYLPAFPFQFSASHCESLWLQSSHERGLGPMAYNMCVIPDELITAPPAGYLETNLYVKHVVIKGSRVQSFEYVKLDNTIFVEFLSSTRGLQSLDRLLSISFKPAEGRKNDVEHSAVCKDILERGVFFSGSVYRFLGHSNSQLKDKTCFLINKSPENIYELLELFGEFSKIKSLAKRAKRIGLLFSTFRLSLDLQEHMYEVIPDVKRGRYIFTDGCGFMSQDLANEIKQLQGTDHVPCVVQIRYQGFKGILLLRQHVDFGLKVQFRKSMRKFKIPDEDMRERCTTLGVVEVSRPYSMGYLNTQITMLLADGGVSHNYLQDLQKYYYYALDNLGRNLHETEAFLRSTGKLELLQKMEQHGMNGPRVLPQLEGLRNREIKHMIKGDEEDGDSAASSEDAARPGRTSKLRVLVPKARLVFGVCDPFEELNYGECFFQPTLLDTEQIQEFYNVEEVIVVRNPCYHPGDVRVLKLVNDQRYAHLSDCLVFPVKGDRPHADESSGGDLDGDKFFVSWDVNLIPKWRSKPFDYSPQNPFGLIKGWISNRVGRSALAVKLAVQRFGQNHLPCIYGTPSEAEKQRKLRERQRQLDYFATYSNELVGRVDAIFMKYASRFGPSCDECVFLNGFFSAAVDMVAQRDAVLEDLRNLERKFNHPGHQPEPNLIRRFFAHMEWSKPLFRPGDDVWTAMQNRASEFVGRMHPPLRGRR